MMPNDPNRLSEQGSDPDRQNR